MADYTPDAPLELRFSHNIIEHLGLKLYQNKPTNVLAELVSNSWDADSSNVWIDLLTTEHGSPRAVLVADNGSGMGDEELMTRYLVVGLPKRKSDNPAELSPDGRMLMGRKGIGKLAPFGVAKEIDLLTVKNFKATWLRFDLDAMLRSSSEGDGELARYEPKIICRAVDLADVDPGYAGAEEVEFRTFISRISQGGKGTLIAAKQLTLKRVVTPEKLKESLGRRFTVTLARQDFQVTVNDTPLSESDVFPPWEVRIPAEGFATGEVDTPAGKRPIRYWAGFVGKAEWSTQEAGVGVYAHGKIGQDRPFVFGNKGGEIFARYLYAVVEADWVDELAKDAISTDRTSMDWEDENLEGLYQWGQSSVKAWISAYEKHRKDMAKNDNTAIVDAVVAGNKELTVRDSEKEHLVALLSEVTPKLDKDPESKQKLVEATVKAWVHEPARRLIKKLWEEASEFDPNSFSNIIVRLVDQLVPESLSLAVVFAQRVYALTQLENHIMRGKETQLQELLEQFPWMLDNNYERFSARISLKKTCEDAERAGQTMVRNVHLVENKAYTKPDFVFLANVEDTKFLIVELKGPDETAAWPEYQQLWSYISYLQSRFPDATIDGMLIARSFEGGIVKQKLDSIQFKTWHDLLLRSRKDHMELLAAILAGTGADPHDARIKQICELGGAPVTSFLESMSAHNDDLRHLVSRLKVAPAAQLPPPAQSGM